MSVCVCEIFCCCHNICTVTVVWGSWLVQGAGQRSGKIKECFSGGVVGGLTGGWGCVLEDGKVAHDSVLPDHAKMNKSQDIAQLLSAC